MSGEQFIDAPLDLEGEAVALRPQSKVHIRLAQRKNRKFITTVEGLDSAIDLKKVLAQLKRSLSCNGVIINDATYGLVLQVQGNHCLSLRKFIVDERLAAVQHVIVHGQ